MCLALLLCLPHPMLSLLALMFLLPLAGAAPLVPCRLATDGCDARMVGAMVAAQGVEPWFLA